MAEIRTRPPAIRRATCRDMPSLTSRSACQTTKYTTSGHSATMARLSIKHRKKSCLTFWRGWTTSADIISSTTMPVTCLRTGLATGSWSIRSTSPPVVPRTPLPQAGEKRQTGKRTSEQPGERLRESKRLVAGRNRTLACFA